jgi:carboxyl-terminal processing protease
LVLAVVALATFFGGGWLLRQGLASRAAAGSAPAEAPPVVGSRLFQDVLRHVRSYAVDSLDEARIYRMAAAGMLDELNDPYAALVPSGAAVRDWPDPPLGLYLDLLHGAVTVVSVRPGSPAAVAGVRSGDLVHEVDDRSTEGMRPEDLVAPLGGGQGTEVRLRLVRGGVAIRVTVTRGPVPALPDPALEPEGEGEGEGVARIRVAGLAGATAGRVAALLDSAVGAGRRAVMLDLRGAVEGRLADAGNLAGLFLPAGAVVVARRGREAHDSTLVKTPIDGRFLDIPMVLLVDRGTAGAAEVVAGALQDHDRALLVGEPTFGRGSDRSLYPLGNGMTLRLTTSHWLTPSGRVIQRDYLNDEQGADREGGRERPVFRTGGGRRVLGGGGIVPDREIEAPGSEPEGADPAVALARELLTRARSTRMLLSLEAR